MAQGLQARNLRLCTWPCPARLTPPWLLQVPPPSCSPSPAAPAAPPLVRRSWWLLDLGPQHQLICNYYSLRHDASTDFLRSWVLQARGGG